MSSVEVMVVVEGQTEQTFVRELLAPYLATRHIYLQAALLGKPGHKGGSVQWVRAQTDIGNFLKQRPDTYVSTMFDYFRIAPDWPGLDQVRRQQAVGRKLRAAGKAALLEEATKGHAARAFAAFAAERRFIPYFEMHEFEALLFSDGAILADALRVESEKITEITARYETPEEINDDPAGAPSKRLAALTPSYKKVVMGTMIATRIGLPKLRMACPHFDQWVNQLEGLVEENPDKV